MVTKSKKMSTETETKKSAPKKVAATKKTPSKRAPAKKTAKTPEELYKMVETAAYYLAMHDHFKAHPAHYWHLAEKQVHGKK
jgi:Protein of unknown function (DUF2934)